MLPTARTASHARPPASPKRRVRKVATASAVGFVGLTLVLAHINEDRFPLHSHTLGPRNLLLSTFMRGLANGSTGGEATDWVVENGPLVVFSGALLPSGTLRMHVVLLVA